METFLYVYVLGCAVVGAWVIGGKLGDLLSRFFIAGITWLAFKTIEKPKDEDPE